MVRREWATGDGTLRQREDTVQLNRWSISQTCGKVMMDCFTDLNDVVSGTALQVS